MQRLVGILLGLLILPALASARTWYVLPDGGGDAPTVPAALDSAQAGDDVLLAAGTYGWSIHAQHPDSISMVSMKSGVWLHGESGAAVTILDGEDMGRLVNCFNVDSTATISDLTFTGGLAHDAGGIYSRELDLTVQDNVFLDNYSTYDGGGFYSLYGDPDLIRNRFEGNHADVQGGGAWLLQSNGLIADNVFLANTAVDASGGLKVVNCTTPIRGCTFVANEAPFASAIGVYGVDGNVDVERCLIAYCEARNGSVFSRTRVNAPSLRTRVPGRH